MKNRRDIALRLGMIRFKLSLTREASRVCSCRSQLASHAEGGRSQPWFCPLWSAVHGIWRCCAILVLPLKSLVWGFIPMGSVLPFPPPQWKDPFEMSNFSFPLSKQTVDDEAMAA